MPNPASGALARPAAIAPLLAPASAACTNAMPAPAADLVHASASFAAILSWRAAALLLLPRCNPASNADVLHLPSEPGVSLRPAGIPILVLRPSAICSLAPCRPHSAPVPLPL